MKTDYKNTVNDLNRFFLIEMQWIAKQNSIIRYRISKWQWDTVSLPLGCPQQPPNT